MKKKGFVALTSGIYLLFFACFALFMLAVFLQIGVKAKGSAMGAMNSEVSDRLANAVNLIQTYDAGTIQLTFPGKYAVELFSRKRGNGPEILLVNCQTDCLYYFSATYNTLGTEGSSKAFTLNSGLTLVPFSPLFTTHISRPDEKSDKFCVAKVEDKIYIFSLYINAINEADMSDKIKKVGGEYVCELNLE